MTDTRPTLHVDSLLKREPHGGYTDSQGVYHRTAAEYWSGIVHSCGCGDPAAVLRYLRDVCRLIDVDTKGDGPLGSDMAKIQAKHAALDAYFANNAGAQYLAYYVLTHADLLEHGGSVPGWLTETGRQFMEDIDALDAAGVLDEDA